MSVQTQVVTKTVFFLVAFFKRPSRPQILTKPKNFKTQKIANDLKLMLSFEIFQKYHSQPELWPIPFSDKSWHFLTDFYTKCHFLWFSVFSLPYVTFFVNFLSNPPQKSVPKGRIFEGGYNNQNMKKLHPFVVVLCKEKFIVLKYGGSGQIM